MSYEHHSALKLLQGLAVLMINSFIHAVLLDKAPSGNSICYSSKTHRLSERFSTFVYTNAKESSQPIKNIDIAIPIFRKNSENELTIIEKTINKLSNLTRVSTWESYGCKKDNIRSFGFDLRTYIYSPTELYIIPIVFGGSIECLNIQIQRMQDETWFNPRAILVFMMMTDECEHPDLDGTASITFLNNLWSQNLFSSSLVMLSTCDSAITVITANPFTVENPGRKVEKRGLKYFRSDFNLGEFNFDVLHRERFIKDFDGSIFILGTSNSPPYVVSSSQGYMVGNQPNSNYTSGTDIEFIKLLSDKNNFTTRFFKNKYHGLESWVKILPNKTNVGIMSAMLNYKVDAGFGGILPSFLSYPKFDYSPFYSSRSYSWYVSDPEHVPGSKLAFLVFPTGVWGLSAIVYLVTCVTYIALERIGFVKQNRNSVIDRLADFLLINLGLPSTLKPKVLHLRVVLFSWIIYSLNWSIMYQTMLFALESNPPMQKGINTFEDLHKSGLKIGMNEVLIQMFSAVEFEQEYRDVLGENFVCNDFKTCLQDLVLYRNFSLVESEAREYEMELKKWRVHRIRAPIMKFPVAMVTNKGNPLSRSLNELLQRSYQSGLVAKWERSAHWLYQEDYDPPINPLKRSRILAMSDVIGAFHILAYGLTAAFVTFVGELLVKRISRCATQNRCDKLSRLKIRILPAIHNRR